MKDTSQRKPTLILLLFFRARNVNYISTDVFFREFEILKIPRWRDIHFESLSFNYFSSSNKEIFTNLCLSWVQPSMAKGETQQLWLPRLLIYISRKNKNWELFPQWPCFDVLLFCLQQGYYWLSDYYSTVLNLSPCQTAVSKQNVFHPYVSKTLIKWITSLLFFGWGEVTNS